MRTATTLAVAVLVACAEAKPTGDSVAGEDTSYRSAPGYVVDSVFPPTEMLRRFQQEIGRPQVTAFTGGASSRAGLVEAFVSSLQRNDGAAIRRLAVSLEEFAWLVHPSSAAMHPPYVQPPGFVWSRIRMGDNDLQRLLQRRNPEPRRLAGHRCDAPAQVEGDNRIWAGCVVLTVAAGDSAAQPLAERLFGRIIERQGQFKFLGFASGR